MTPLPPWAGEAQSKLEQMFPHFPFNLHFHKHDQVEGACPFPKCRGGEDRLVVFQNGNVWCRRCNQKASWRKESEEERKRRQAKEQEDRRTLRQVIAQCTDWVGYHDNVGLGAALWKAAGITNEDIDRWGLGYCDRVPNCGYDTPSLTIPVFYKNTLVDIRHRVLKPQADDKYRSHLPKLPPAYFNLDGLLNQPRCFFVEGEKKAIVVAHNGLPVASFPGLDSARYLTNIIPQLLTVSQELVFLPDPGSETQLAPTFCNLRSQGYIVKVLDLFMKPDDFVLEYGTEPLLRAIPQARWY